MKSSSLTAADYAQLADFRHLLRRFLVFSEKAAAAVGLTPQQHQALLAIKGAGDRAPMTTGELAERLLIRHHSTVGLIDRLAAKGLVQRRSGRADRRQVRIALTAPAKRLLAKLTESHHDELRGLAPLLRGLLAGIEAR